MPLVSVLVTAYNREKYIGAALDSILASTFQDFEVIVVDDNSADDTFARAKAYAERDARVAVFRNEQNLGDYPNRNRAAALATGTFLKYVDSDDLIYPHGLEVFVRAALANPGSGMVLSRPVEEQIGPFPITYNPIEAYRKHYLQGGLLDCGPSGVLLNHQAFRELGGFAGLRLLGDTEMWLRLAATWPVTTVGPGLVWWRRHEMQETEVARETGPTTVHQEVLLAGLRSPRCPLPPEERAEAERAFRRAQARGIVAHGIRNGAPVATLRALTASGFAMTELVDLLMPRPGRNS